MKARGKTREILKIVGDIQDLVGEAIGLHWDDKDTNAFAKAQEKLQQALDLCIVATGMYDQIQEIKAVLNEHDEER